VCGIPATVTDKSGTELMFEVPAGAQGPCLVEVDSPTGTFEGSVHLTVL
jgi:hypothetical protein